MKLGNDLKQDKQCPVCGKDIYLRDPTTWAYRRTERWKAVYYCSYGCMRAAERKEGNMKAKYAEMIDVAIACIEKGEDPVEAFEKAGMEKPLTFYGSMKAWARKYAPDKYSKLPKNRQTWKNSLKQEEPETAEDAMAGMKNAAEAFLGEMPGAEVTKVDKLPEERPAVELVYDPGIAEEYRREQAEKKAEKDGKITKPVCFDGLTVREVEGEFGKYRREMEYGKEFIRYEGLDGGYATMRPWEWAGFMKELKKAAAVLGVSVDEA